MSVHKQERERGREGGREVGREGREGREGGREIERESLTITVSSLRNPVRLPVPY